MSVPLHSLHTERDVIIATFTKGQIEKILTNNAKNIPAVTVSKLKALADTLQQNEMLVMKIIENKSYTLGCNSNCRKKIPHSTTFHSEYNLLHFQARSNAGFDLSSESEIMLIFVASNS